jgi:alkylhydroperoxidase/carboxymuconolactone decarboxylase family protein YurZ
MENEMTGIPEDHASDGPWAAGVRDLLAARDPRFAADLTAMSTNPWTDGVLSPRMVELVAVAVNVAVTSLDASATRRHMRAALAVGATEDELLTIVKMGTVMALHSLSLGAPILIEEAGADAVKAAARLVGPTPAVDRMKAMGQWNAAWDPFLALDPAWTDAFMATGLGIYASGVFTARETELLSIAFDASITHMYVPGTRRHIRNALAAGASVAEIMAVLKICVARGVEACNLGLAILADIVARSPAEAAAT